MNIGYDLHPLFTEGYKNRGVGVYCKNLINEVEANSSNIVYKMNAYGDTVNGISTLNVNEYSIKKKFVDDFLYKEDQFNRILAAQIQHFCAVNSIDLFHFLTPFSYEAAFLLSLPSKTAKIITIHDFIQLVYPEHYLVDNQFKNHYLRQVDLLSCFDAFICVSDNTADDLIHYANIPKDKIFSVSHGIDPAFRVLEKRDFPDLKKRIGIQSKFLLYVGGAHFTKNAREVVIAYANLNVNLINEYQLVMCGLPLEMSDELNSIISNNYNNMKNRVVLTPFIAQEELIQLYNMADLFVFPSRYEGFGFPLVEAFACGTPVVTSNNSSLRKLSENCAIQVDPSSVDSISEGIQYALLNHEERKRLSKAGLERAAEFTWASAAKKTIEVYEEVVSEKRQYIKTNLSMNVNKRVAWFSPMPPLESGISGYSYEILSLLQNRFIIDIFIDIGYTADTPSLTKCGVYPYTAFTGQNTMKKYDAIVYQMGASSFHTYILKIMKEYPGIVVNHDSNYHNLLTHLHDNGHISDIEYLEYLILEYGEHDGKAIYNDIQSDIGRWINYPAYSFFLGESKKQIVLTEYNKTRLLERDIGMDISVVHLHASLPDSFYLLDASVIKDKIGLRSDALVISSFGSVQISKRNLESIRAFERIISDNENAYFYFIGQVDESYYASLQNIIGSNPNLSDRVVFTGRVSDDEFLEYLKITDVCISLRTDGYSTSGPLVKALGAGIPCITSNIEAFNDIDSNSVIKINIDEDEIHNLSTALSQLLSDNEIRNYYEQNAKATADQFFSLNNTIMMYEDIIMNLVNSNKKVTLTNSDIMHIAAYFRDELNNDSELKYIFTKEIAILNSFDAASQMGNALY